MKSFLELLTRLESTLTGKMPFVAYSKPNKTTVKAIFQKDDFLRKTNDFTQKGFVFAPFLLQNDAVIFSNEKSEVVEVELKTVKSLIENPTVQSSSIDKDHHVSLVNKTIDFITSGKAEKIVISRKEEVELHDFSVSKTFERLLKSYATAMVYVWYHPKVGLWMGATPETLVSVQNNEFKTMALAGTQSYNGTTNNVTWQQKEIDEQQFVTDYIAENLKNKISDINVSKPYTVKAGNLLHLRTDIRGSIKNTKDVAFLIQSLHPTPAVCGLPKEISQDFIVENENYNREFYTGFLGELNSNNQTNLFVNLRCMQIKNDKASLYIGGGITKDSNAENEWLETIAKAQVMKRILQ